MDEKTTALLQAAQSLLEARKGVEMVYDECYYFVWKSNGRHFWTALQDAVNSFVINNTD